MEREMEHQASAGQGRDMWPSAAASWGSSVRASTGDNSLGAETGTVLLAQLPIGTLWDPGCSLRQ